MVDLIADHLIYMIMLTTCWRLYIVDEVDQIANQIP
jgi:hypothetical protein